MTVRNYHTQQGIAVGVIIAIIAAIVLAGGATYIATQDTVDVEIDSNATTTTEMEQGATTSEDGLDLDLDLDGALDANTSVDDTNVSGNVDVNVGGGVSY